MKTLQAIEIINSGRADKNLALLYRDLAGAKERLAGQIAAFEELFGGDRDINLFSVPGRTELGGNHTDHQRGRVLAASVGLDIAAVASRNSDNIIRLKSQGMDMVAVDLSDLSIHPHETGHSPSLIRGICFKLRNMGRPIGGFDAYTTSTVPRGSGLSSSAAFEVLICIILSGLYGFELSMTEAAAISQFAENVYFDKPCGLMDQLACSIGGILSIDFELLESPKIQRSDYDLDGSGHSLIIVNTGGSHSDLTPDYAAIPDEMRAVAATLGKEYLGWCDKVEFYANLGKIRGQVSDRAILRAIHFFADDENAMLLADALSNGEFDEFLRRITLSGQSSYMYLQNAFSNANPHEQGISLGLALSGKILNDRGAYRVHGGGFAGTIQAFVPHDLEAQYIAAMEELFGAECCVIPGIRSVGATEIEL